jgi:hypothetical protein
MQRPRDKARALFVVLRLHHPIEELEAIERNRIRILKPSNDHRRYDKRGVFLLTQDVPQRYIVDSSSEARPERTKRHGKKEGYEEEGHEETGHQEEGDEEESHEEEGHSQEGH